MENAGQERQQKTPGKRKRPFGESVRIAYSSVSFTSRQSTGHPRSPHRFFKDSYTVCFDKETDQRVRNNSSVPTLELSQVVHHHVNGLCIVTAGENLCETSSVSGVEFAVSKAPACSAAEKRKRQTKMLKGGKVANAVSPTTVIAHLRLESGGTVPIYACVWGTIIELNKSITPDILIDDPLLDGYLAVILPSGSFPPKDMLDDEGGERAETKHIKVDEAVRNVP